MVSFHSFTFFSALLAILSAHVASSLPLAKRGFISLPLQRMDRRVAADPQLSRRLARRRLDVMTGQDLQTLEARYSRHGVPARHKAHNSTKTVASLAAASPNGLTEAADPTADDSIGLEIEGQDVGYLAKVQIGSPPRDFLILMDSGSADFWVGSEQCSSEGGGGCGNHNFLGRQTSSSFKASPQPFQVTYGTGNVQGAIVKDDILIAGLALKQHIFGVATQESIEFSSSTTPFDGLMGLAQSTLSEQQTLTPVEALFAQGLIKAPIVSFKIPRFADRANDGEITFGALDPTKFDAQTLVTVPNVNPNGFWEASLDGAAVNGAEAGLQGRTAILDTGTTLIVMPAQDALAVHTLIPGAKSDGQGGFTVPCNTDAKVAFTFGGQSFDIDPRDIAFQPVDPLNPQGDCISGIAAGDVGGPNEWLVGDVFLKNAYFSTDTQKNTLSLAKLV